MTSPQFWLDIFRFSNSVRWQMTCKPRYHRVSVKPGLWPGLDWTDQNSCIHTANTTKVTAVCLQFKITALLVLQVGKGLSELNRRLMKVLSQQTHVASVKNMDAQNHLQNPQGVSQSHLCWNSLNMCVTFDLSEIEKRMPRGLNSKESTWGRAGNKLL